jgi:hypothetical protein
VPPRVRKDVYDSYWRFAAERHAIFQRRFHGLAPPWTDDPILSRFKFCNTYRAADRVTQYLLGDVIYDPAYNDLPAEDMFCRVVLFRLFSRTDTWDTLERITGGVRRDTLQPDQLGDALTALRRRQPIYTSAFILAPPSGPMTGPKHFHHLSLVAQMFRPGGLGHDLVRATTLRSVVDALLGWPTIGPFLAYQIAIDLNYTPHLSFDENDYTLPGPGAVRGLRKVFIDDGGLRPASLIAWMVDRQDTEFARLGLPFEGLFGRPLHAIDCQGLFCEIDKYSRVAFPELTSARTRIKHAYRLTGPLPAMTFPPQWNIPTDRLQPAGPPREGDSPAQLRPLPNDAAPRLFAVSGESECP